MTGSWSTGRNGQYTCTTTALDRLDEAFLLAQSIGDTSYERQRDRLREELTLAQIDHHAEAVDELDVQGIPYKSAGLCVRAFADAWH